MDARNASIKPQPSSRSARASVALLLVLSVLPGFAPRLSLAQSPSADDFNPGASATVYSLTVQADGKILVGRDGSLTMDCLWRLNADGTVDNGFRPGADDSVRSLVVQADGKILVGGGFSLLGGELRNRLGRLNADGTLDSGFNPGAGGVTHSTVGSLVMQADGKILVGGYFTMLGGQRSSSLGRLNTDGTLDSGFNPTAGGVTYPTVSAVALQPDGKILVGGYFTTLCGQPRTNIAKLNADGTLDSGFNPGASGSVYSLALQADGKILVGGYFTKLGGQPRNFLGRLNADGTLDSEFNPGANNSVHSLAVRADGKILVGGLFTTLCGQPRNSLGRLNTDGTLDSGFNPGADAGVFSLAAQADGKILVGGNFYTLGGQPRSRLGRLNNTEPATQSVSYDGSTVTWLRGGASPEAWRTTFDYSSDGLSWTNVGVGTRVPGGWALGGLSLSAGATLRMRGFISGGAYNSSGYFVEGHFGAPAWVSQPASQTNKLGETARFNVVAWSDAPLTYQWFKDDLPLINGGPWRARPRQRSR